MLITKLVRTHALFTIRCASSRKLQGPHSTARIFIFRPAEGEEGEGMWRWWVAVRLCEWGCESVSGVWTSGPGGDWRADFIRPKEETKEDASREKKGKKKVPSLICEATAWHISNLYAQLSTGRLIFPLPPLSLSLHLDQTEHAQCWTEARLHTKNDYDIGRSLNVGDCASNVRSWRKWVQVNKLYKQNGWIEAK